MQDEGFAVFPGIYFKCMSKSTFSIQIAFTIKHSSYDTVNE